MVVVLGKEMLVIDTYRDANTQTVDEAMQDSASDSVTESLILGQ